MKKITTADLKAFYKKYYVAKNAVVAIVGAVTRSDAELIAGKIMGQLEQGEPAPALPAVKPLTKADNVNIEFPSSQTHILIGQPGISRDDPDYYPLYVGNHVLGGSGLVSIIADEIREKRGLAYSSYSYFIPMRVKGPFIMGLETRNDKRDEALRVLRETLKDFVQKGPTQEQLNAAKKNLTGGFALKLGSNQKIAGYISAIGFYNLPLDYLDRYIGNVEAVTVEQVRDAFRRRVDLDKMVTVMVGGAPDKHAAK